MLRWASCAGPQRLLQTRGFVSSVRVHADAAPVFQVKPLNVEEINKIKIERFGTELEQFKAQFEAPVFQAFSRVKILKKLYGDRKARRIMGKSKNMKIRAKAAKKKASDLVENKEKKIEKGINNFLKRDTKKRELLFGRNAFERQRREALVSRLMSGHFWEPQSPDAEYSPENPPPEIAADPLKNWKWEQNLSDFEIAEIIAKEMQVEGLEWDKFSKDAVERQERATDQDVVSKMQRAYAFGRAAVKESDLVEDRPAILKKPRIPPVKKAKKEPIHKVSDLNPIAFETTHFPLNTDLYSPYRTRKVTMYIKVKALNMPAPVEQRFIELTSYNDTQKDVLKPRYDAEKDILKLASRAEKTLRGNRGAVVKLFRKLVNEAWKADLNFVPAPFELESKSLPPHQRVEIEEKQAALKEQQAKLQSFESVKEAATKGFTVFRLTDSALPNLHELKLRRQQAEQLIKNVKSDAL